MKLGMNDMRARGYRVTIQRRDFEKIRKFDN